MRPLLDPYNPYAGGLLGGAAPEPQNPLIDPLLGNEYGLLTPDRPQDPPVNTIPRGAPDPFDRYNDPWGEVPMIINNPFADPPPPEPKRLPRPLPFQLGPPTG